MNNVYMISDLSDRMKKLQNELQISDENIIKNKTLDNEKEYHDWLTRELNKAEIEKIIIPLSLPTDGAIINTDGLLLALHIRLNYEVDIKKRLIPIIFLSNFTVENIISKSVFDKDNNPQNLIFTKGIYFTSFDTDEVIEQVEKVVSCPENQYHERILSKLNVKRKATTGGHDIANAWGCFKLAQITGSSEEVFQLDSISRHLKQIYAKCLICENETYNREKRIDLEPIKCHSKKVLFIDDKADEGWSVLMKNIFKTADNNFVYVDSSKYKSDDAHRSFNDFEGFYKECQSHIGKDWDLIIIDLRLNPEIEDIDNVMIDPKQLLGYKIIDEFLSYNEGYQIMISTASNKIWNINAALKRGVYSYYIKESPEFNYSLNETKKHFDNFKNDVKSCFNRSYLRDIWKTFYLAKKANMDSKSKFISESNSMLDISWNLIRQEQLDLGFLTLFQIIETYANRKYDYRNNSILINGNETKMIEVEGAKEVWQLTFHQDRQEGDYFSSSKESKEKGKIKANSLFKISCILNFIFKKNDESLKSFGKLNDLRHNIAHNGPKNLTNISHIVEVLDVIKLCREYLD